MKVLVDFILIFDVQETGPNIVVGGRFTGFDLRASGKIVRRQYIQLLV